MAAEPHPDASAGDRQAGTHPPRRTRQRAAVEAYLATRDDFATAQQVHEGMRRTGDSVGLATVYRTLQALVEGGATDAIRTPDGEWAYRRCDSRAHHHHLVCRECGHTEELVAADVEEWARRMAAHHGFTQVTHDIELFGLCSSCASENRVDDGKVGRVES